MDKTGWWQKIRHTVWGAPRCVLCHGTAAADALCTACMADLAATRTDAANSCPTCTRYSAQAVVCGQCQQHPPACTRVFASQYYVPPLVEMLHRFKYQGDSALLPPLAALMRAHPPPWLPESGIDAVVAMPLSAARLAERGFNQSAWLAENLAAHYGWPCLPPQAVQRAHRPPQSTLSRQERRRNVRGVFQIIGDVKNRNLLLIDDVVTTGATINELAQSLKRSGAAAVYAWTLAHPQ
ncbi:ComF family protein [Neisseria sp. HSC-16F19]|nr:ComF family protein [Neisseria sp. HSC-16F19]MCP2039660.1 ComF family protein [Neisseria sp. HSC-16F19]